MVFTSQEHYNVMLSYYLSNIYLFWKVFSFDLSYFDPDKFLLLIIIGIIFYFFKMFLYINDLELVKFHVLFVSLMVLTDLFIRDCYL